MLTFFLDCPRLERMAASVANTGATLGMAPSAIATVCDAGYLVVGEALGHQFSSDFEIRELVRRSEHNRDHSQVSALCGRGHIETRFVVEAGLQAVTTGVSADQVIGVAQLEGATAEGSRINR